jgi:hypothetical protein
MRSHAGQEPGAAVVVNLLTPDALHAKLSGRTGYFLLLYVGTGLPKIGSAARNLSAGLAPLRRRAGSLPLGAAVHARICPQDSMVRRLSARRWPARYPVSKQDSRLGTQQERIAMGVEGRGGHGHDPPSLEPGPGDPHVEQAPVFRTENVEQYRPGGRRGAVASILQVKVESLPWRASRS